MRDSEVRRLEMFMRVREFGTAHVDSFPRGTFAAELFTRLGEIIDTLEAHSTAQDSGRRAARQSATSKAVARDELRRDLEAISRTARGMAVTTPGLDDMFRLPRNVGDQALLTAARSFATDALPLKDQFIRRGLPTDFLDDLNGDIEALEQAVNSKIQGTESHVAATAAIDGKMEGGMNTVRELDPIMRNMFAGDPATLAAWLSASHVERAPRPSKAKPVTVKPATPDS